jgi:GntR family transcriptional regulator
MLEKSMADNLPIHLDFRSGEPIYVQIIEQVRDLTTNGVLKPGQQLPTVRQLALELRVNFNTVARAYRLLDEAGLISTQQGRGTYLLEQNPEIDQALRRETLNALTAVYLHSLTRHGYSLQEAREEMERQSINPLQDPLSSGDDENDAEYSA